LTSGARAKEQAVADSREAILSRLAGSAHWVPADPELPPAAAPEPALAPAELAGRFVAEARRIDAEAFLEGSRAAALERLAALLRGEHVLAWDLPLLPASLAEGVRASGGSYATQAGFDRARVSVGLTGCNLAVAETGSILVSAAPGAPREASLIVRTHVALVDLSRIVPDLVTAFARIQAFSDKAAHVNLISGPSRTADIEMTLTRGVHGPKRLVLVVAPWFER
jgi:L-lactate dehydrogenase complex protein LldG